MNISPIENFPSYSISTDGVVKNIKSSRVLHGQVGSNGYKFVKLINQEGSKRAFVHNLVASTFLVNEDGCKYVDHINSNKLDNRMTNLELKSCSSLIENIPMNQSIDSTCFYINQETNQWFINDRQPFGVISGGPYASKELARKAYIKFKKKVEDHDALFRACAAGDVN